MKLEALILAAGSGSRMVELTRNRPKCLLPVGNHCLLWFAITGLQKVGVNRIIILVPDIHETEIKQYCNKKFNSCKHLEFAAVPTKADLGTSQSILSIKDRIRGDFIVHSCDSIVEPKALLNLVNHYRLYDPMLSMLIVDDSKHFVEKTVPGRSRKERNIRDIMIVEPLDKLDLTTSNDCRAHKIILMRCEQGLGENLRIRNKQLALHPSLTVHSNFLDTHIYIFKRDVLNIMESNQDRTVLKGEMIPFLISKQFAKLKVRGSSEIMEDDDDDEMTPTTHGDDYEDELREKLEEFNPRNLALSDYPTRPRVQAPHSCHSLIVKNLVAYRVNTLSSFLECNRDAKSLVAAFEKGTSNVKDCAIPENSVIGQECTIKDTSIGNNCSIGDKVRLINCTVMDNVEIKSGTNLTECTVGSNSKIDKCTIKKSSIGNHGIIEEKVKLIDCTLSDSVEIKSNATLSECIVGSNSKVKKCTIKKGSFGNNCIIGEKVKLIDCVLMDNVEIESDASLSECIVGSNSKICSGCSLKSCLVGFRQVVPGGTGAEGELIIEDGYVIDEMISY